MRNSRPGAHDPKGRAISWLLVIRELYYCLYLGIGLPCALFALNFLAVLAAAFRQAKRFDDMKDVIKPEIGRVEGVLSVKIDALSA
jgi:hypothetical protein